MYLPKSKYKGPFTATGGENRILVEETKEEFKGQYFVTYKGEMFEGKFPKEAGRKLIFAKELEEKEAATKESKSPKIAYIKPTENDYEAKKFKRYFCKDKRSGKIIEVNQADYNNIKNFPSFIGCQIEWWLEGPAQDTSYNGYIYKGAVHRNGLAVDKAEKEVQGIKNFILDLAEFVV